MPGKDFFNHVNEAMKLFVFELQNLKTVDLLDIAYHAKWKGKNQLFKTV